jgi:hypothetical protein
VIQSGTPQQSLHARRIYPIRKRGNLLLCTILLGNVAVNALLSILMADFTSGPSFSPSSVLPLTLKDKALWDSFYQRESL